METYITKCKWIANGNLFYDSRNSNRGSVTKNGWGGRWEGGLGRRRHGCNYGWFFLMYNRKPQNTVKQLSFNLNKEKKKRKKKWWRKRTASQVPGYQDLISDLKTVYHLSYSLGLDPSTAICRGESAIYPSLPKARTPLVSTEWKHLLYCPLLTSWRYKISLQWIFCGRKRRGEGHQGRMSWISWSTKAFLSSLLWSLQGSWKAEMIETQEQTHRLNKCLLTPASTELNGSSRR